MNSYKISTEASSSAAAHSASHSLVKFPQTVSCPRCGARYRPALKDMGLRTLCRKCNTEFHLLPPTDETDTAFINPLPRDTELSRPVGNMWLDLRPGQIIDDFCIVEKPVGQGGLSQVFKVRHIESGTEMALKLPKASTVESLSRETLFNEAAVWLTPSRHPNLMACHYVRLLRGQPAIFLEYVPGDTLSAMMQPQSESRTPKLYRGDYRESALRILDFMIQAAWGLKYSHSAGLMHLDIKPMNLFVSEKRRLLLGDFGMVRIRRSSANTSGGEAVTAKILLPDETHTKENVENTRISNSKFLGTYQYFSPEAANDVNSPRPSFDLWALTLTILECFLGHRPWEMGAMVGEALEDYLKLNSAAPISEKLKEFFRKALSSDEKDRFQNAGEIAEELMNVYEDMAEHPYPRPRPQALEESAGRLNNKAISLFFLEKYKEAELLWRKAIDEEPENHLIQYNRFLALYRQKIVTEETLLNLVKSQDVKKNIAKHPISMLALNLEFGLIEQAEDIIKQFSVSQRSNPAFTTLKTKARFLKNGDKMPPSTLAFINFAPEKIPVGKYNSKLFINAVKSAAEKGAITLFNNLSRRASQSNESQNELLKLKSGLYLKAKRLSLKGLSEVKTQKLPFEAEKAVFAANGNSLLISHSHNVFFCWRDPAHNFIPDDEPLIFSEEISAMVLNTSGRAGAVFTTDGRLCDLSKAPYTKNQSLDAHNGAVNEALFMPGGQKMISAGEDGEIKLWDYSYGYLDKGVPMMVQSVPSPPISTMAIRPDGRLIFTAGPEEWQLLSPSNLEPIRNIKRKGIKPQISVADPFGEYFLVASEDATLTQFFPESGRLNAIKFHDAASFHVKSLAISPDGRLWAAAINNKIMILSPPTPGKQFTHVLKTLKPPLGTPIRLYFYQDMTALMALFENGTLNLWRFDFEVSKPKPRLWKDVDERIMTAFMAQRPGVLKADEPLLEELYNTIATANGPGLDMLEVERELKLYLNHRLRAEAQITE